MEQKQEWLRAAKGDPKVGSAYEGYKAHLKKRMHYDTFIDLVDRNIDEIQKGDHAEQVAKKVEEWADKQLIKEKKMDPIIKFFHKLVQFIQGYGFRTAGKYGKRLSEKITLATKKDVGKKAKKIAKGKAPLITDTIALKALETPEWGRVALRVGVLNSNLLLFNQNVLDKFMEDPKGIFDHYKGIGHDDSILLLTKKALDKHLEKKEFLKIDALLKNFNEWEKNDKELLFDLPDHKNLTEKLIAELPEEKRTKLFGSAEVDLSGLGIDAKRF